MRYLTTNTCITPTKKQIQIAFIKVKRATAFLDEIDTRLKSEVVEVKSWFGLRRKTMTQHEHILQENKDFSKGYHTFALELGYITLEEEKLSEFAWRAPSLEKLEQWKNADKVYLGEWDHDELIYAITKEFE